MKKILYYAFLFLFVSCSNVNSSNVISSSSNNNSSEVSSINNEIKIEELYSHNNDLKIYGKLYIPSIKKEKYPLVILSHSAFLTNSSLKSYAYQFAKRGFLAYSFDFCGGSSSSKSDGDMKKMTIFTEVNDLKAVIDDLKIRNDVDQNNILLFGTSQGGLVSSLVANDYNNIINKLILLYPAFNIPDQAKNYASTPFNPFGDDFINTLIDYDPFDHINNFKNDVIIFHGTSDTTVDISYSIKASEIYSKCSLIKIDNAGHGFNNDNYSFFGNYDDIVWKNIDSFL